MVSVEVRQKGSHIILQLETEETTVTVPVPNHPEHYNPSFASLVFLVSYLR
ncbi:type II toxin-antitoxin system HicA family toxin [Phormidesmis sp. 146-12]